MKTFLKVVQTIFGFLVFLSLPAAVILFIFHLSDWGGLAITLFFISVPITFAVKRITEPEKNKRSDFVLIAIFLPIALYASYLSVNQLSTYEVYNIKLVEYRTTDNKEARIAILNIPRDKEFDKNKMISAHLVFTTPSALSAYGTQPLLFKATGPNVSESIEVMSFPGSRGAGATISPKKNLEFIPQDGIYFFYLLPKDGEKFIPAVNSATLHFRVYR